MQFRPCIDIHNGKVKQIVGGSLKDWRDQAKENFVAAQDAPFYARLFQDAGLVGGHVVLLNARGSEHYESTKKQALAALRAYPGGLQAGGGITPETAGEYLEAGASHVIVTSYVFQDGRIHFDRLEKLAQAVGREYLVLDVSCKKCGDDYLIMTDRWQKMTQEAVTLPLLERLAEYCDEFLVHAVDVEGLAGGIEEELVALLGNFADRPVTYAGGVRNLRDLERIRSLGQDRVNVTIGSALDLYGGSLQWKDVLKFCRHNGF